MSGRSRRILFFADASHVHTRRWVQAMVERGFECIVATRLPADLPGAAEVVAVHPGSDAIGWFAALPSVRALARRLAPQWIHGHYVTSYGLWAASCRGIAPVVLTAWGSDLLVTPRERGWRGRFMHALVGWSLRRADLVTADASDVIEAIRAHGVAAPCHELLWGVDTQRFCPVASARSDDAETFEIVSLRQWEANYHIDVLLHAVAQLRREPSRPRIGLTLLGGGSREASLRRLAAELDLGDAVRFVGRVDDAGMVAALQRADVSVSVPSSDATSVAMLESMSCGLPVIASDLPANRAWIDAAQLVPAGDADALAAALRVLRDDPQRRRVLGERNRRAVVERASRRVHMDRMAALYESLRPAAREAVA